MQPRKRRSQARDKDIVTINRMEYQDAAALAAQEYGKGSDWVHGLYTGKTPADTALKEIAESPAIAGDYPPFELSGGKLDKIGGEVDISNQSLEYLNDIAEIRALGAFDVYNTVAYEQADELLLNQKDAELMRSSANSNVNIYYLNYSGGVKVKNDITQGMNLDEIKQTLYDESEAELETGISFIEEVVVG